MSLPSPIIIASPFPTLDEAGVLRDGFAIAQSPYCRQVCQDRVCGTYIRDADENEVLFSTCPHGFSVISARTCLTTITVNGVLEVSTNQGSRTLKKDLKRSRKVKKPQVIAWIEACRIAEQQMVEFIEEQANESIAALHDIKAGIGTLQRTVEELVYQGGGGLGSDGFLRCDPKVRTIYENVQFLWNLLQLLDVLANPASAKFGQPGPKAVYKLIDLLRHLITSRADKKQLRIRMSGSSFHRPRVYESFAMIPFVLLDNAIKYAQFGTEIRIDCYDRGRTTVVLEVATRGRLVAPAERQEIFKKHVRGSNATGPGTGLGLYLAAVVAEANECKLEYFAEPDERRGGIGWNKFRVVIPGIEST